MRRYIISSWHGDSLWDQLRRTHLADAEDDFKLISTLSVYADSALTRLELHEICDQHRQKLLIRRTFHNFWE